MFADSFCDSLWDRRSGLGWTTLASFALQALAVGGLLTLPFLSTQSLQELPFVTHLMVPVSQATTHVQMREAQGPGTVSIDPVFIVPPRHTPIGLCKPDEGEAALPNLPIGHGNADATGIGDPAGVIGSIGETLPVLKPAPAVRPARVSVMMEGNLIHRVQPQYPPIAIQTHTRGSVVLRAVISREGNIENLQSLSGHPMLVKAAMDAVRQWHYQPYYLNHEPVEVETQITVNFVLGGR